MKRFYPWLRQRFLPEWARRQLEEENRHLRQKVDRLQRENDRLNTYLDGLEAGLRAARSLRREGGEPA